VSERWKASFGQGHHSSSSDFLTLLWVGDPPLGLGPDPHELVRRVGQNVSHKTFNLAAENNDAQILPTPDRRGE